MAKLIDAELLRKELQRQIDEVYVSEDNELDAAAVAAVESIISFISRLPDANPVPLREKAIDYAGAMLKKVVRNADDTFHPDSVLKENCFSAGDVSQAFADGGVYAISTGEPVGEAEVYIEDDGCAEDGNFMQWTELSNSEVMLPEDTRFKPGDRIVFLAFKKQN